MSTFDHILAPGRIGRLELKNRVLMPPMGSGMGTPEGWFSERQCAYYAERARGGAALIVTELTAAVTDFEILAGLNRADTDEAIPGIRALADAVHAAGGKLAVQLTAGQGRNNPAFTADRPPVSASDNPNFFAPDVLCRALETEEVATIVRRFGEAALRCAAAGVDMIDVHGHTGYLIDQFLGRQWNRRTDQYGGSVENRTRFAAEIVQAIKGAVPQMPVSFRLSVSNRMPGSRDAAEAQQIALILQEDGVDLLMADDGAYDSMDYVFPPYYLGDAPMVGAAQTLKEVLSIPVLAVGNLKPGERRGRARGGRRGLRRDRARPDRGPGVGRQAGRRAPRGHPAVHPVQPDVHRQRVRGRAALVRRQPAGRVRGRAGDPPGAGGQAHRRRR